MHFSIKKHFKKQPQLHSQTGLITSEVDFLFF